MVKANITKLQLDENLLEEFRNSNASAAWTNPQDKRVYVHHSGDNSQFPFADKSRWVTDISEYNAIIKAREEGKLSESEYADKITFGIFNTKDGWDERAKIWIENVKSKGLGAVAEDSQGIKPQDYSGIEVAVIETAVYGMQERNRTAQNVLKMVALSGTKRDYPEQTSKVTINRDIDFTSEIPMQAVGLKHTSIELKCDASHFAIYDHVKWRNTSVDPLRVNLEAIATAWVRDKADQVISLMFATNVTVLAGTIADWGTSTSNPYLDIERAQKLINDNGGVADRIMMHSLARAVGLGNPNTKNQMSTSVIPGSSSQSGTDNSFFPSGYTVYIDPGAPTNALVIFDSEIAEWDQGPEGSVQYRQDNRFRQGYIRFSWNRPLIKDFSKIRRITPINTVTP